LLHLLAIDANKAAAKAGGCVVMGEVMTRGLGTTTTSTTTTISSSPRVGID
jgi:hypothetical protein